MRWLQLFVLVLAAGTPLAATSPSAPDAETSAARTSRGFPAAGLDRLDHEVVIDLWVRGREGKPDTLLESLSFEGRMLIERGDPYTTETGVREVAFRVQTWEATAWSDALGCVIVYRTGDLRQPLSRITAEAKGADFPATFDFNLDFSATVCEAIWIEPHHGRPKGHGFMEVPPSGNRRTSPTITSFEDTVIEGDHPKYGTLYFKPKSCNDRSGTTLHTFTAEEKKNLDLPRAE